MMEDADLEQRIEQLVNQKIQEQLETVQLATLRKEFLTREEFMSAMDRMDQRFEQLISEMNQRFEAVDRRFEAVDRRFEAVDKRFEQQISEMDRRFEAVDKRFEAADKRFEDLMAEVREGFKESRRVEMELKAAIGNLGERSGINLQETILQLMDSLIVQAGVDYSQVERVNLTDYDGTVFFPGFTTDVDVVAQDGEVHLFEVKYKADQRDFFHFLQVARLYEAATGTQPDRLFMITLEIAQKTLRATAELPIEVIAGSAVL